MAAEFIFGCAICADGFDAHKRVCALFCGHMYHKFCLKKWFDTQIQQRLETNCPKCRAKITWIGQILPLYLHQVVSVTEDKDTDLDEIESNALNGTESDIHLEASTEEEDDVDDYDDEEEEEEAVERITSNEDWMDISTAVDTQLVAALDTFVEMMNRIRTLESNLNSIDLDLIQHLD